jgi:GT2 family glycosyltransferase
VVYLARVGRTSIVVVTHNHREYVAGCVRALERAGLPPGTRLVLVDNASSDGTAELLRTEVLSPDGTTTRGGLPALLLAEATNQGFAGGNNLAIRRAMADSDAFVYLLNPDTEVQPGFLDRALAVADTDPRIALVQSLLLRHPETHLVNSYGNALHYLGIGYAAGDGRALDDPKVAAVVRQERDIPFASGAAVLARLAALEAIGLFNEELFVYCEDLELSWRARLAGWRVVFAPGSRVGHKYQFSRSRSKYYWIERNRLLVLAWTYRLRSLALIAPALLALELGTWAFAVQQGWWPEKARAYRYLFRPGAWRALRETRRRVQALRTVEDRDLAASFTGEVDFSPVSPWLLTRVANPLLAGYWRLVRGLMRW